MGDAINARAVTKPGEFKNPDMVQTGEKPGRCTASEAMVQACMALVTKAGTGVTTYVRGDPELTMCVCASPQSNPQTPTSPTGDSKDSQTVNNDKGSEKYTPESLIKAIKKLSITDVTVKPEEITQAVIRAADKDGPRAAIELILANRSKAADKAEKAEKTEKTSVEKPAAPAAPAAASPPAAAPSSPAAAPAAEAASAPAGKK